MRLSTQSAVVIAFAWAMSACSQSPRLPAGPSPAPVEPAVALEITRVFPPAGSTAGGTTVEVIGEGFMPAMTVEFDGIRVSKRGDPQAGTFTTFYTEAPPHAVGPIDIVVTNPDGRSQRLAGGYTYAEQGSFDPNGAWGGYPINGSDTAVDFVIRDDKLISASCQYYLFTPIPFSDFPSVQGGEFSLTTEEGARLSGKMVSATEIVGTLSYAPCTREPLTWRADRKRD